MQTLLVPFAHLNLNTSNAKAVTPAMAPALRMLPRLPPLKPVAIAAPAAAANTGPTTGVRDRELLLAGEAARGLAVDAAG
jgi:hypothetical protein